MGPPLLANLAVFLYSVVLCMALRWLLDRQRGPENAEEKQQSRMRPRGRAVSTRPVSKAEGDAQFRHAAEQTLKETFLAYLINIALGLLVCLYREQDFLPVMYGGIGLVTALFSPFGVGMMAATNVKTGRPDPGLMLLGLCCIVPGITYVVVTAL